MGMRLQSSSCSRLRPKSRRLRGGNATLEIVFTLLPTFAFIFGFCDIGLMLFRWSTLQNAVREGTRYAITFQTMNGRGQDASIKATVAQYAMGFQYDLNNVDHTQVNYYSPANLNTPIVNGGNIPGNIVEVSVQGIPYLFIAALSGDYALKNSSGTGSTNGQSYLYHDSSPLVLNVYSADILGGLPVGVNSVTR